MDFNAIARSTMRDAAITMLHAERTRLRAGCAALLFAAACALGGCANSGATSGASGAFAMASAGGGATVPFEPIDGPPPPAFSPPSPLPDPHTQSPPLST